MARALALAIALSLAGCGQATPSRGPTSVVPVVDRTAAPTASSAPSTCNGPFQGSPAPPYAFSTVAIPAGTDSCYVIGQWGDPQPWQLTNDGPIIAFNGRDIGHEKDLWVGDIAAGTVKLAYQAKEGGGEKVEIAYPQMAGGSLVWLERLYEGKDISGMPKTWSVKKLDVSSGLVSTLASGKGMAFGGEYAVDPMRYDGRRIGLGEGKADGSFRIEVIDTAGGESSSIALQRTLFDFALVEGGVVYTEGTNDAKHRSMGQMHTMFWTTEAGAKEMGTADFAVAGNGSMLALINDPESSDKSTGSPIQPRIRIGSAPFTELRAVSSVVDGNPSFGAKNVCLGSGAAAWWEDEGGFDQRITGALTVWRPEWRAPVQVKTAADGTQVSVNGGWLVWFEMGDDMNTRVRGVPLSVLTAQTR